MLVEGGAGAPSANTPEDLLSPEAFDAKMLNARVKKLATDLAEANGLTDAERAARPELAEKTQELKQQLIKLKANLEKTGKTPEEAAESIMATLNESGLNYERIKVPNAAPEAQPVPPEMEFDPKDVPEQSTEKSWKFSKIDLKNPNLDWQPIADDEILIQPNQPEAIDAVRRELSQPEGELMFRMMSEEELQKILDSGVIKAEERDDQVEKGTTWWGDQLKDTLSQRSGVQRVNAQTGARWGGNAGVMVAVRRSEVMKHVVESRARAGGEKGSDAHKTKGEIPASAIVDIIRVSPGRGEDAGTVKISKLRV